MDASADTIRKLLCEQLEVAAPEDTPNGHFVRNTGDFAPRPIVFYLLSNNGGFNYANFLSYMSRTDPTAFKQITAATAGVVWDSSPCAPYPELFARGFVSVTRSLAGLSPLPTDPLLTPALECLFRMGMHLPSSSTVMDRINDGLDLHVPVHAPQLFIGSEADTMVLWRDTQAHIERAVARHRVALAAAPPSAGPVDAARVRDLLARGLPTEQLLVSGARLGLQEQWVRDALAGVTESHGDHLWVKDFVDSPHVDHLRRYPQEYKQLVHAFMELALRR
jgi:hypothetical protein